MKPSVEEASSVGVVASKSGASISAKPADEKASLGQIEVGIFAPYNESVELLASWNEWKAEKMQRGSDGRWTATVKLPDGDHAYKFRVKSLSYFSNGTSVSVFDPYAMSVTDDDNQNSVLRVRDGRQREVSYQWKHDGVPLPANRDLIIYELHVGDFTGGNGDSVEGKTYEKGQFVHVIEKLDYLADLGINCIELMPVKEFRGKGWGYTLRSLFAVENSYGTPDDLCRLIDEAHGRGMRVFIDGVYNHADKDSPLAQIAYEYWFYKDNPDPEFLQFGPKFNYKHYDENLGIFPARKYVNESLRYWVREFHIDGIRFDATRAIADFDVIKELAGVAHEGADGVKPFYTVAEHVPEDPIIAGRDEGRPMDGAWHDGMARLLQAMIIGKEIDGNSPTDLDRLATEMDPAKNGYLHSDRFVNFIGNHDFNRILHLLAKDAEIVDEAAFRRVKLGTALLMMAPGLPMLWMGQEFGFSSEKSLEPRPLDWTLLKNQRNADLLNFHKHLIAVRKEHDAVRSDSFHVVLLDHERQLLGFKRFNDGGDVVVVLVNLKDSECPDVVVNGSGLEDGVWVELLNGGDVHVTGGELKTALGHSQAKVFVRKAGA